MFNSSVIDVGIGLMFVYLILGLMCTAVNEWIAQFLKMRAATLREGIQRLLPGLANDFYKHALVKSLGRSDSVGHPSYVPARTFAMALIDILSKRVKSDAGEKPLARIASAIEGLPDFHDKKSMEILLQNSEERLETFQKHLETWYEDAMDRVSGWYKKKTQIITACVAVGVTIFANADTVQIARRLFLNPTLRGKIVQEAAAAKRPAAQEVNVEYTDDTPIPTAPVADGQAASTQNREATGLTAQQKADLGELTGWSSEFKTFNRMRADHDKKTPAEIAAAANDDSFPGLDLICYQAVFWPWFWMVLPGHLIGWFLTAVAASLGAPFWFDTLNKFMNVRSAGTAPGEKGKDRSKV